MSLEALRHRNYLGWQLFLRDFNFRYRQTFFGYFWAIIKPIMLGGSVILFGSQFAGEPEPGDVPFAAYSFVGLTLLRIFWDAVMQPQWVTRRMRGVFRRGPFPHEGLMFASVYYIAVDASVYFVFAVAIILISGATLAWTAVFALLLAPVVLLAGLSLGIYLAPITLVYMDARYSLPALFPGLLLTVPILYRPVEGSALYYVNLWNPVTYLIGFPRDLLFGTSSGYGLGFALGVTAFLLIGLGGVRFFRRSMRLAIEQV